MEHPKFAKYKNTDKKERSRWFNYCHRHQIPYITIEYRTSLADIEFDYITYDKKNSDDYLLKNKEYIKEQTFNIFDKYSNKRSNVWSYGWSTVKINNIDLEQAEDVAIEIYNLITEIIPQTCA
ncbi:hypothetical protein [Endozoicomonas acroporae]|uniref:hypothetical protein n=1 Tax=Endozoicomonas acroporae TaxID=1701104 RepID=UPI0013D1D688|nr:hypothetical protein [Endozoicomonas acroporae]